MIDTGWPVVQVAGEIGVGEALLGRWVALERARTRPPAALDVDERAELTSKAKWEARAEDESA